MGPTIFLSSPSPADKMSDWGNAARRFSGSRREARHEPNSSLAGCPLRDRRPGRHRRLAGPPGSRPRAEAHACAAVRQRHELEKEVTVRQRLEQELQRRAQELAEMDRRKDEFLAMLGHELRNPLAPLRNAVEIMRLRELADPQLQAV